MQKAFPLEYTYLSMHLCLGWICSLFQGHQDLRAAAVFPLAVPGQPPVHSKEC